MPKQKMIRKIRTRQETGEDVIMVDTIQGRVTKVIDGDTFDMNITGVGANNSETYNSTERIRLADMNDPELKTIAGQKAKQNLKAKIDRKMVKCKVQSRDSYGRLVCKVTLV